MRQERPVRVKAKPHAYLEAIVRRAKRIPEIYRISSKVFGRYGAEKAILYISYKDGDWSAPDPVLEEQVNVLRREFSAAFPEWGIAAQWRKHDPYAVRPVASSVIMDGYVWQTLDCGHRVRGERIRTKRHCSCCTEALTASAAGIEKE